MKVSFTILLILVTTLTFSQEKKEEFTIKKGTWSLASDFSVNIRNNESSYENSSLSNENFNFRISPKLGYAINDNLILGLGLGYSHSKNNTNNNNEFKNISKANNISVFGYIKKFFPINRHLALSLQGETRYGLNKTTNKSVQDNNEQESKMNTFFIGIKPGIHYMLTKNILLQANFGSLGYRQSAGSNSRDLTKQIQKNNSFNFNFQTSSLMMGLTWLL